MTETGQSTDDTDLAERQFDRWFARRLWEDAPEDAKERLRESRSNDTDTDRSD
jgi:hypothetical protein